MAGPIESPFTRGSTLQPGIVRHPRPMLYAAIAVSIAAHGMAAGLILHKVPVAPSSRASNHGSRVALIVNLHHGGAQNFAVPGVRVHPAASRPLPRPAPPSRRTRTAVPRPAPSVAPPMEEAVPVAAAPVIPALPTPPAADRFAGLFSPVGGPSMGRGRWGGRMTSPPVAQDPYQQRAQAWQMALHGRLNRLAENLRGAGHQLDCRIVIDTEQRAGEVHCMPETDQAAPWSYLQDLLIAGEVADSASRICFRLAEQQLSMPPCPTAGP